MKKFLWQRWRYELSVHAWILTLSLSRFAFSASFFYNFFSIWLTYIRFFFIRTTLWEQWGSDRPKIKNNLRTSSGWGWKKVKMFPVEFLLNVVMYVRNVHKRVGLLNLHKKICLQFGDEFSKTISILNFRTEKIK